MNEREAWIADCHILGIEGDEEFSCQAAVWADSASEFRAQLDLKLKAQGFKTLWLEECLKAPEYVRRHGHQQKIGALARAVHPGHLVELSKVVAVDDGAEVEPESYLIIEEIEGVEPLDQQFGIHPKKSVPDAVHDALFDPSDPTEAELEHYGDAEAVPSMRTYAILDAAKVLHLPMLLASSDLKHRCLFKGDAADELKNVAPYLVELEDGNTFTRNLFTSAGMPSNMWDREPGIYIRSRAQFDDIWKHFRKFTRVKDANNKWFMFRFWDGRALTGYLELFQQYRATSMVPLLGQRSETLPLVESLLCQSEGRTVSIRANAFTGQTVQVQSVDIAILRYIALIRHAHQFVHDYGPPIPEIESGYETAKATVLKYFKCGFKSRYHLGSFVFWTLALKADFVQGNNLIKQAVANIDANPNDRFVAISREMRRLHKDQIRNYRGRRN